jgi:hypothetical protein
MVCTFIQNEHTRIGNVLQHVVFAGIQGFSTFSTYAPNLTMNKVISGAKNSLFLVNLAFANFEAPCPYGKDPWIWKPISGRNCFAVHLAQAHKADDDDIVQELECI